MFTAIRKFWHIWNDYPSFRVVYSNGEYTYLLGHYEAWNLAEIFKGTIVFDPDDTYCREIPVEDGPPWYDLGPPG